MPDDITERYPQLADLDGKDDDQRIEVFRDVLGRDPIVVPIVTQI